MTSPHGWVRRGVAFGHAAAVAFLPGRRRRQRQQPSNAERQDTSALLDSLRQSEWWTWRTRPRGAATAGPGTTAQLQYASVVKEHISPALRELGFRGSGGRYDLPC